MTPDPSSVPVTITGSGITPSTILLVIVNFLIGGAIWKAWPALRKITVDREANLLSERAEEMASMRERMAEFESRLEIANEEIRVLRHGLANAEQSLDMFIALIESNPERAAEHAAKVKDKRDRDRDTISREKAIVMQARVSKAAGHA